MARAVIRVASLPLQPHCFGLGGFEVQMLDAIAAVRAYGLSVSQLNPWSREESFDVLHLWGLEVSHLPAVEWATRARKPVVLTALLPYWSLQWWVRYRTPGSVLGIKSALAKLVTHLVVVNELQKRAAKRYFRAHRVSVIPNIVSDPFFSLDTSTARSARSTVLCVGNICSRKNQVALAHASKISGCPVHFVGSVVPGEERYADELARLVDNSNLLSWATNVAPGSPALLAAYGACIGFALPSLSETQPISALEALAAGKRILLGDRFYAHDPLFSSAIRVDPLDKVSIARGLRELFDATGSTKADRAALNCCRSRAVADGYARVYEDAISAVQ